MVVHPPREFVELLLKMTDWFRRVIPDEVRKEHEERMEELVRAAEADPPMADKEFRRRVWELDADLEKRYSSGRRCILPYGHD